MDFRLLDKDAKETVHEGKLVRLKAPQSISWGIRVFVLTGESGGVVTFREVDNFRIGR